MEDASGDAELTSREQARGRLPAFGQLHEGYRIVLLAAGLAVAALLFRQLVTLLVAILVTVILSIPLSAAAGFFERFRVPRVAGALIGLLGCIAVVAGTFALIIPPFIEQTEEFIDSLPAVTVELEERIGEVVGVEPARVGEEVQAFLERYTENPETLIGPLTSLGLNIAGILAALVFMVLTAFYIAVRPDPLVTGLLSLFPPTRRDAIANIVDRLRTAWVGWLQGVVIDMFVTGTLLYAGLTLIDLDFAIFFAVFSALLVVIPYFGAVLGAIPVVLFALADSPTKALLALLTYVVVQQIEGNVIIPLVMAQRVKLHPALIAVGVVLVGQLFGFIGLFVAVPILSAIVILVQELWVKPLERERGVAPAEELEVARAGPPEAGPAP
jgi:predicted PurR-regulated permease PerM